MPIGKHYVVTQSREVKVYANCAVDAARIADVAFQHGQDADGGVAKDKVPEGVWGNTASRVEVTSLDVSKDF